MTQENNAENYKADFDRIERTWNELPSEKKTPDYFVTLFSDTTGTFENLKELKAVYPFIDTLLQAQEHFTQEDKNAVSDAFKMILDPELQKDFMPYFVDTFIQEVKEFDPKKEYEPTNMKGIMFQHGTFNLIAARPSRGKTSLITSLAIDALTKPYQDNKVIFLTLEETNKEIYTRIFNNLLFSHAKKLNQLKQISRERPRVALWNTLKDPENPDNFELAVPIKTNVIPLVKQYESTGRLQVLDFGGKSIHSVESFLRFHKDAIVFIDYITLIKPDADYGTRNDDLANISTRLVECAKSNNQIIIAAAQLRRLADGATDSDKPNTLNDTLLRECGQFEQDANTIIALGRNTQAKNEDTTDDGEPIYFWKILKNRNGGGINKSYCFDTCNKSMGYSYLLSTSEPAEFLDTWKEQKSGNSTQETTTEPKNTDYSKLGNFTGGRKL